MPPCEIRARVIFKHMSQENSQVCLSVLRVKIFPSQYGTKLYKLYFHLSSTTNAKTTLCFVAFKISVFMIFNWILICRIFLPRFRNKTTLEKHGVNQKTVSIVMQTCISFVLAGFGMRYERHAAKNVARGFDLI